MRTITIEKKVATYSELTEEQKLKVLENFDNVEGTDFHEGVYEDKETILKLLGFSGIEFRFSGFWSQGDGASFTAKFNVPTRLKELKERVTKVKEYAPDFDLFNYSEMIFETSELGDIQEVHRIDSRYCHSSTISADNEGLKQFARDFSDRLYSDLEAEYEYLQSREAKEESIEVNEYEFDLDTLKIY